MCEKVVGIAFGSTLSATDHIPSNDTVVRCAPAGTGARQNTSQPYISIRPARLAKLASPRLAFEIQFMASPSSHFRSAGECRVSDRGMATIFKSYLKCLQ